MNLDSTMIKSGPMASTSQDALIVYSVIAQNKKDSFYSMLYDGGNDGLFF